MLHIVQVVLTGGAEIPRVFLDEAKAHAAFVDCAKKYWAQSYAAYCERNGFSSDSFSSAQAFVASFDLADKSKIQYWTVTPEDAGSVNPFLSGAESLKERREHILRLTKELEQTSCAVKEGLIELLDTIAGLTGDGTERGDQPAGEQTVSGIEGEPEVPSSPLPQEVSKDSAGMYNTQEWKDYVESIRSMCGGSTGEFKLFTRYDWRQDVYSNLTSFEYWEWVAVKIDNYIEKAQNAGYTVFEDPENSGQFRYKTPDGMVSEIFCYTEGETWCRAGLHSEG